MLKTTITSFIDSLMQLNLSLELWRLVKDSLEHFEVFIKVFMNMGYFEEVFEAQYVTPTRSVFDLENASKSFKVILSDVYIDMAHNITKRSTGNCLYQVEHLGLKLKEHLGLIYILSLLCKKFLNE